MGEQIAEGDPTPGRERVVQRPVRILEDADVCELRRDLRDGVVKRVSPLVEQRQCGNGRDGLRERRDSEDRVAGGGQVTIDIAPSDGDGADGPVRPPDQRDEAGVVSAPSGQSRRKPKGDKRARTRAALLVAARRLVRERGYARTTMEEVAARGDDDRRDLWQLP
jgi:hypothetical protein